jgi:DNA-binding transcriptional ArsR family regulator
MVVSQSPTGDELLKALSALSNPHRLRIVAALAGGTTYVSQLARDLGMSRPLLHMHLQRLEAACMVRGRMEVSEDGKALRFCEVTEFAFHIDPAAIVRATQTLSEPAASGSSRKEK